MKRKMDSRDQWNMSMEFPNNPDRRSEVHYNLNLDLSLRPPCSTEEPIGDSPVHNTASQQPEPPSHPLRLSDSLQSFLYFLTPQFLQTQDQMQIPIPYPSSIHGDLRLCPTQTQDRMIVPCPSSSSVRSDLPVGPRETPDRMIVPNSFTSSVHSDLPVCPSETRDRTIVPNSFTSSVHGDLPVFPSETPDQMIVSNPFTSSLLSDLPVCPRETPDQMLPLPQPFTSSGHSDEPACSSHIHQSNSLGASSSSPQSSSTGEGSVRPARRRRNPRRARARPENLTITPAYPWATDRRAVVHRLTYLKSNEILTITGDVKCKRCERVYQIEYDLVTSFLEVGRYVAENKDSMHERAPAKWMIPPSPPCKFCNQQNVVEPVIAVKNEEINWLFMLLGQTLGHLTLEHLKYFCEHTDNHRTGAKNRLLYLTYLTLCRQLDPLGPFDR